MLLCLLSACQPAARQAEEAHPAERPVTQASVSPQPAESASPAFEVEAASAWPDNPWNALALLPPAQLEAVRQAFSDRQAPMPALPGLGRKLDYLKQLLTSAYLTLLQPSGQVPTQRPPGSRPVRFKGVDGLMLHGLYVPAAQPTRQAVILLHGFGAQRDHVWIKYGVLRKDYNLLLYDSRGHGGQAGRVTLGALEARDLQVAIRWLQAQGQQSFALMGESMGGAVAIVGGALWAQSPEQARFPLKGVWSDAAYADLDHALSERAEARLSYEAPELNAADRSRMSRFITSLFFAWLQADTGLQDLEGLAAPRRYLPLLVPRVAYAQVHSREDVQTRYTNARLLEAAIAGLPSPLAPRFWATSGEHVESWRDSQYLPRLRRFLAEAFGS